MDDSSDWLYTTMLTGMGVLGPGLASQRIIEWQLFSDYDDLNLEEIKSENARVRAWMDRHPDGVKYCFELDAIHEDLDWLLVEWDTDVEVRYNNRPDLMWNAVFYHVHNFHYRVYAYREKVAQLLNACLDLGQSEREVNSERILEAIGNNPERRVFHDLLSGLINDKKLSAIVKRRNEIGHRAVVEYKSGKSTWQLLTPGRRAQEYFSIGGLIPETELFGDLVTFHQHESREMREVITRLKGFRYDLTRSLRQLALMSSG